MKYTPFVFALVVSIARLPAHEFWIQPENFSVPIGAKVNFSFLRGEYFTGELLAVNTERVAGIWHHSADGTIDELKRVPSARYRAESLSFTFNKAGTHMIAEDSTASAVTLPPEKFLSYLNEEGLESIAAARKSANKENEPGREQFLRCVKTLILVGGKSDDTYAKRTGQRLEIVPQSDPLKAKAGERLAFRIYFDGKPLTGGLVRAWHCHGADLLDLKQRTISDGSVGFDLPHAGPWMISLVHMIPLTDEPGYDWKSYWGNLTFELPR